MKRVQAATLATVVLCGWSGAALAQSAATCQYDAVTASVTVAVNGVKAKLQAITSTGEIRLDGVPCAGATLGNADTIQVVGGALPDVFTLTGKFAPGLTPETDGSSEIEVSFALGGADDDVTINLSNAGDTVRFSAAGLDVGGDGDEDLIFGRVEALAVDGRGGNDTIDATAYSRTPKNGLLELIGGAGDDLLIGSAGEDTLDGEGGDDTLYGGPGDDTFYGGDGMDDMYGQGGDDRADESRAANGSDLFSGGVGVDRLDYDARSNPIYVDLGNGVADEGEIGENDSIQPSVEVVHGGQGDDVMIGSDRADFLYGNGGNDEIHGGPGDDHIDGGRGDDDLFGDAARDGIVGGDGNDFLDAGTGGRYLWAVDGNDELTSAGDVRVWFDGGPGDDIIHNGNNVGDQVYCEAGFDQADADPLDDFLYGDGGCEVVE